MIRDASGLVR